MDFVTSSPRKRSSSFRLQSPILLLVWLLAIFWLAPITYAATYYVDASQPDDGGDGTTWETAKRTIAAGITVSAAGDTILVKYGNYLLSGSSLSLSSDRCMISDDGTHTSWDTAAPDSSQCIIDAGLTSRVLTISGEDVTNATEIRGFMITGGDATAESNAHRGGGILIAGGADPIVENCWIKNNIASTTFPSFGGGVGVIDAGSAPTIRDSHVSWNTAQSGYSYGYGGGIFSGWNAGPTAVLNNTITNNTATTTWVGLGGGVHFWNGSGEIRSNTISYNSASGVDARGGTGGGVYLLNVVVDVWENTITHNAAARGDKREGDGGGLFCGGSGASVWIDVWNNEISHNVGSAAGRGHGGGIYCLADGTIHENVISDNTGSASNDADSYYRAGWGGGVFYGETHAILTGNTITSNTASLHGEGRGGGIWFMSGNTIERNLIYLNVASAAAVGYGGGALCSGGIWSVLGNNTFYRNANTTGVPGGYGSGLYIEGGYIPTVVNNIFAAHDVTDSDSTAVYSDVPITISYNCFHENPGGDYNANVTSNNEVSADPRFTDPDNGDFTLLYDSPAIEAGDPDTEVPENGGWRVDIGALEYTGTRHLRAIPGPGEFLFGGQVKAKVNLVDAGTVSSIDMIVYPGETHPEMPSSVMRWHDISPTGDGATFDLTLSYREEELNGQHEGYLCLWRWTGSEWDGPKEASNFDVDENWVTVSGQTAFSEWVIKGDSLTSAAEEMPQGLDRFRLSANVPNPFGTTTTIHFAIPEARAVNLSIFDLEGRLVRAIAGEQLAAGIHSATWDGRDDLGRRVAPGVYFYRLDAGGFIETKRMLLME